jgi:hypothetical protein
MLGIRGLRRGIHMTASAMARTDISVTELVSHPEMSPLNEVALLNMPCSNTRCMSAGARSEWACEYARGSLLISATHPLSPRVNGGMCTASRDRFIQLGKDAPYYTSPRGSRVPGPRPNPTATPVRSI